MSQEWGNSQAIEAFRNMPGKSGVSSPCLQPDATQIARLAAIVQSSEDAIIGQDLNGIVESWNRGAELLYGYSPVEMIGGSMASLLPADRGDEEEALFSRIQNG